MISNPTVTRVFLPIQLISAMTNKLDKREEPLPQDIAEGVESDEWVSGRGMMGEEVGGV